MRCLPKVFKKIKKVQIHELRAMFKLLDCDGSGSIAALVVLEALLDLDLGRLKFGSIFPKTFLPIDWFAMLSRSSMRTLCTI